MKVTADTITDEQIRELRGKADASGDIETVYTCCEALGVRCDGRGGSGVSVDVRRESRVRCADAWNARHGGSK